MGRGQMIEWNKNFTSVRGKVSDLELEAQLIKNTESTGNSRRFLINSVDKMRAKNLVERLKNDSVI